MIIINVYCCKNISSVRFSCLFCSACKKKLIFTDNEHNNYIVFILNSQNIHNNCQILLKIAETSIVPIVFKDVHPITLQFHTICSTSINSHFISDVLNYSFFCNDN